jgi:hypothetical protein
MDDVWVALVHARPTDEEADHVGAFTQAAARAHDLDHLVARVGEALAELGYELVELDDPEPIVQATDRRELPAEMLENAIRAAASGAVEFLPFHTYADEGDTDGEEDAAPPSVQERLEEAAAERSLVRVATKPEVDAPDEGFVVGLSADWLLLHVVSNQVELNGYLALRREDVVSVDRDVEPFVERAFELRGDAPEPLVDVALVDARAILTSAQREFPLVSVDLARRSPGTRFIGRVHEIDDDVVTLLLVDTAGEWADAETYAFSDVTAIGFGDRYMEALALVAGEPPS